MNIQIIRIYAKMHEMILMHKDILLLVEQVETKLTKQDQKIETLFNYLQKFLEMKEKSRTEIGFKRKAEDG